MRFGLERVRNGPSVGGGSFAATWARMVLKRWGARETFLHGRKLRAAKNSVLKSGANSLNASGVKLTRACVPRTGNGAGQLKMLNNKNERAPAPMLGYFPVPPSTKQFTSGWHAVQLRPIRPSYGGRSGPRTAEIFQHSVKFQSRLGLGGQVSIEIILRSLKYGRWTGF